MDGQTADCSASFTVKAFEPPTINCSANPTTIRPGDTSTITSQGVSPQNRPLTYSYSASAGSVSGSGTSANRRMALFRGDGAHKSKIDPIRTTEMTASHSHLPVHKPVAKPFARTITTLRLHPFPCLASQHY